MHEFIVVWHRSGIVSQRIWIEPLGLDETSGPPDMDPLMEVISAYTADAYQRHLTQTCPANEFLVQRIRGTTWKSAKEQFLATVGPPQKRRKGR